MSILNHDEPEGDFVPGPHDPKPDGARPACVPSVHYEDPVPAPKPQPIIGATMDAMWRAFSKDFDRTKNSAETMRWLKRCFYAGALSVFAETQDVSRAGSQAQAYAWLARTGGELASFNHAMKQGHA